MFDSRFGLSSDLLDDNLASDDSLLNGPWPQISLDRLLKQHDLKPSQPVSIDDTTNNDFWSSSPQYTEFVNNYPRQFQQPNQPIDISSLLSLAPSSSPSPPPPSQQQQFQLLSVDNHIFEPQSVQPPLFFSQYSPDTDEILSRHDSINYQQQSLPYENFLQKATNIQRQRHHRTPPILQVSNNNHHQQQRASGPSRYKRNQPPAYVTCLNHDANHNDVSGPPILLPPSF